MKKKIFIAAMLALSLLLTGCSDFDYITSGKYATITGCKADPVPTDLVIPNDINGNLVIIIQENSFSNQSGIRSIALPNSLRNIERGAFENCINLTQVVFPNSLTELNGFKGCSGLTSISLSNASVNINEEAFMNCSALSNITFSPNTISIGNMAFANCTALKNITFSPKTTSIGDSAFMNCSCIEQLTFADDMKTIGSGAFANCTALKSIDFTGSNVDCIAEDAFSGCTNIESVSLTKAFIDTYIVSETAPSELFFKSGRSEMERLMSRYSYKKATIPIPLTELIPSIKKITVDGVDYSIEDFNKLWRECWTTHFEQEREIHTY